jgi:hypothetical protein
VTMTPLSSSSATPFVDGELVYMIHIPVGGGLSTQPLVTSANIGSYNPLTANTIQPYTDDAAYDLTLPTATGLSGMIVLVSTGFCFRTSIACQATDSINGIPANSYILLSGKNSNCQWYCVDVAANSWSVSSLDPTTYLNAAAQTALTPNNYTTNYWVAMSQAAPLVITAPSATGGTIGDYELPFDPFTITVKNIGASSGTITWAANGSAENYVDPSGAIMPTIIVPNGETVVFEVIYTTNSFIVYTNSQNYSKFNNYAATVAPVPGDDNLDGYTVGSEWHDVTHDVAYKCLDSTTATAVWNPMGLPQFGPLTTFSDLGPGIYTLDGSAGAITFNLPVATGLGDRYVFVASDVTNAIAIHPDATNPDTINGSSTDITLTAVRTFLSIVDYAPNAWVKIPGDSSGLTQQGTVTSSADAGQGIYSLDSSTLAFTFDLPASSGGQSRYMFIADNVATNGATIGLANAANSLNGVVNGTYAMQTDMEIVLALDTGNGWVLSNIAGGQTADLQYFSITNASFSPASASTGISFAPDLTLASIDETIYDPYGMLDTVNNNIVIQQSGTYHIIISFDENGAGTFDFYLDAAASQEITSGTSTKLFDAVMDLTAGQTIQVGSANTYDTTGFNYSVTQLPTTTIITPVGAPYSTTETLVNRKWTDGSDIYEKTITYAGLTSTTNVDATLQFGAASGDVNNVISMEAISKRTSFGFYGVNYVDSYLITTGLWVVPSSSTFGNGVVTVQYTKVP